MPTTPDWWTAAGNTGRGDRRDGRAPRGLWGLVVARFGWQVFPLRRRVVPPKTGTTRIRPG